MVRFMDWMMGKLGLKRRCQCRGCRIRASGYGYQPCANGPEFDYSNPPQGGSGLGRSK